MQDRFDVVVVGAGAAGIAALRRLRRAGVAVVALEARSRVGGRALTLQGPDFPVDLGCGWLHSADVNPLVPLIEGAGFALDRTPPHWTRQAGNQDFPPEDQADFGRAFATFNEQLDAAAETRVDRPAAELLPPGGRWNHLLDAISSYYNGAEYDQVSVLDFAAYEDTGVNYRVRNGYGAAIGAFADLEAIVTDCPVTTIRHDGPELRLETPRGVLAARAAIVAAPTPMLSEGGLTFSPGLPAKLEAAAGVPLGLADKAFLHLAEPQMFEVEGHLFGRIDRTETGSYHLRPFGRPYIEVYLGGRCAAALETEGPGAMAAFAMEELVGLIGSDFRRKLAPIAETAWKADPWARGSYSHALPGHAGDRAVLAAPVDGRLFFAGEATHPNFYSTCHGAWLSGLRAAEEALAALGLRRSASSSG
jgi:monoamine oxidase